MNDQRISYGAKDKHSSVQWILIYTAIAFLVRKNWTTKPSASGSYSRLAYETQLYFKIFAILYRLNCWDFYFVDISALLIIVLEVHFSLFFSNKVYFRVRFVVRKIWSSFYSCQPLSGLACLMIHKLGIISH